jgi:hypothetical protein
VKRVATELPSDWSFANRDPYLLVESDAWTLPYSASVWFLAHQGRIHLLGGDGSHRAIDLDCELSPLANGAELWIYRLDDPPR